MMVQAVIATIGGGFLFPFLIILLWGRMVKLWGALGGWLAAGAIVGTIWVINHGIKSHLIHQTGSVWIDMAWSAAIGVFTASVVSGGKIGKSVVVNIIAAVVGGIIAAFILSMF